jgi:hypothetical protein
VTGPTENEGRCGGPLPPSTLPGLRTASISLSLSGGSFAGEAGLVRLTPHVERSLSRQHGYPIGICASEGLVASVVRRTCCGHRIRPTGGFAAEVDGRVVLCNRWVLCRCALHAVLPFPTQRNMGDQQGLRHDIVKRASSTDLRGPTGAPVCYISARAMPCRSFAPRCCRTHGYLPRQCRAGAVRRSAARDDCRVTFCRIFLVPHGGLPV